MTDRGPLPLGQQRQRRRHDPVQGQRALAAAEHEQVRRPAAAGKALGRRRQCGNLATHRVADGARGDGGRKTAREGLQHDPGKTRQKTVGQACDCVLFVNDERPASQPRGQSAGSADETAHAQYSGRPVPENDAQRLPQRPQQAERRGGEREPALAAQPLHADPLDRDTGGRHHPRLDAAAGAEPDHVARVLAQRVRNRERRVHVAARAAGHHQDRPGRHVRLRGLRRLLGLVSLASS